MKCYRMSMFTSLFIVQCALVVHTAGLQNIQSAHSSCTPFEYMYQMVKAQLLTTVKLRAVTALETKARERTMAKVFMMILAGVCECR